MDCSFTFSGLLSRYILKLRAPAVLAVALSCHVVPSWANGVDYLLSQQNADGSFVQSTDVASPTQSTAETLRAFNAKGETSYAGIPLALDYLNSEPYLDTENLARIIIANNEAGNDVEDLVAGLLLHQNDDGGFGDFPGYDSTAINTAYALLALAEVNSGAIDVIDYAVAWLSSQQKADGSFVLNKKNQSSVYITALVAKALQNYQLIFDVSAQLQAAREYLLVQQIPGGGWQTEWETAVALLSVIPVTTDSSRYADAIAVLQSQQRANGSWADDVFATALAVRVLQLASEITLPVEPDTGSFTGQVKHTTTGVALAAVTVTIDEIASVSVQTGLNGRFELSDIAPGSYTLRYTLEGFISATQTASLSAGQVVNLGTINLEPLPDTGIVRGVVYDATTGIPIIGATVSLTGSTSAVSVTDSNGYYSFISAPGNVNINVSAAGFDPVTATGAVVAGGTLIFSPLLNPEGTVVTDPSVTLTGHVRDGDTGDPLAGVQVSVAGTGLATSSDASGYFEVSGITAGSFTVELSLSGYQSTQYHVTAADGSTLDIGIISLFPVTPAATTTISGTVTDAESGTPLQGANVVVEGLDISVVTDNTGHYRITGLTGSNFTLTASAVGYLSVSGDVLVSSPSRVRLDMKLNRAATGNVEIVNVHIETGVFNYPAFSEVEVDAVLDNKGSTDSQVRMYIKVLDTDNKVVEQHPVVSVPLGSDPSLALLTVPSGGTAEAELEWYTRRNMPGIYKIVAQAYNAEGTRLLSERSIQVQIDSTASMGGSIELDPPITQLASNKSVNISAKIANEGNQIIDATTVTARLSLLKEGYTGRQNLIELDRIITDESFNSTDGLDIDSEGNIYVVNRAGNTVSRIAADGSISVIADGFSSPTDIDIDSNDNIYVLNDASSFERIDNNGIRSLITTNLSVQTGIEVLADGRVLITSNNALFEVSVDGTVTEIVFGGLADPRDMAMSSEGEVFVASSGDNSITRYKNGKLSTFVTGINRPYGLAIDADDDLIVTSFGDNTLLRVKPDGTKSVITTGLAGPYDVIIDANGDFIVSNYMSSEIISVDPAGNKTIIGQPTVNQPRAALYNPAGDLLVANTGSGNIVSLDSDGSVSEIASGITNPVAMLNAADGGTDVLQADGTIVHVAPDGSRTNLITGRATASDFAYAPDGNGYLVVEPGSDSITRVDDSNVFSTYAEPVLEYIRSLVIDNNGDIYAFAQTGRDRAYSVLKIRPDYTVEEIAGGFDLARGMTIDGSGNIYVATYSRREIFKIDPTGNIALLAKADFYPGAVTVTASGKILVAQFGGTVIYELLSDGSLTEYFDTGVPIYYGLIEDNAGDVWVSSQSNNAIVRIRPDGTTDTFTGLASPGSLISDGAGGVYASVRRDGIQHVDSSGVITDVVNHPALNNVFVESFVIDKDGNFLVPGRSPDVYLLDPDSNVLKEFTSISSPNEIIAGDGGEIYIADTTVGVIRLNGKGTWPEVVSQQGARVIAKESINTAIVSRGGRPARLNLDTGDLTSLPYLHTTYSFIESIAVDPSVGFTLADRGENRLLFYDANDVIADIQTGIVGPKGLQIDQAGDLLIASSNPKGIVKLRSDRRADIHIVETGGIDYMLLNSRGNIYATLNNSGSIHEYKPDGRGVFHISVPESEALLLNDNGELLSTMPSQGSLISIATDSSNSYQTLAAGLSNAQDIEKDDNGNLFITDSGRDVLLTLNPDNSLTLNQTNIIDAQWISYSPSGKYFITNRLNRILYIDAIESAIDMPITDLVPAASQFGGMIVDDGGQIYLSIPSENAIYSFRSLAARPEIAEGDVILTRTRNIPELSVDNEYVNVDFGAWLPDRSGEFLVEVSADSAPVNGVLSNTIHVGSKADATIGLSSSTVVPGDQSVNASLAVSGSDSTKVTIIDTDNLVQSAQTYATFGRSIASDSHGNIYASHLTKLVKVTPDGEVSNFIENIPSGISFGMAIDSNDVMYLPTYSDEILRVTLDGGVSTLTQFSSDLRFIALDYQDELYAVDTSNTLSHIDKETGSITPMFTGGLNNPIGLAIDAYGNFYVLNNGSEGNAIVRITSDGNYATYLDDVNFENEGIPLVADCSNNLIFAPTRLLPYKHQGEENLLFQLVGETGEISQILNGGLSPVRMSDMDVLYFDRLNDRLLIYTDIAAGTVASFPVICGDIDAAVHLITRDDVDLSSADPAPSSIVDLTDGTREYTWLLSEVDNRGQNIQLNMLFRGLIENEQRPAFADAYIEFTNSFDTANPVQVPVDIPELLASSQINAAVSTDSAEYVPDSEVSIVVDVSNGSSEAFSGTLDISVRDVDGNLVELLPSVAVTDLTAMSSTSFNNAWNSGNSVAGDYTLVVAVANAAGETIAIDEITFRITAGDTGDVPVITSTITTSKPVYQAWETAAINARVRNNSSNVIQMPASAVIKVSRPDGSVLFTNTQPVRQLYPGSYQDFVEFLELGESANGEYNVTLNVSDVATGEALSSSNTNFQVDSAATITLNGSVDAQPSQVEAGTSITCSSTIRNISGTAIDDVAIAEQVVSVAGSDIVNEVITIESIAANDVLTRVQTVNTTVLPKGDYLCMLAATVNNDSRQLAADGFRVNASANVAPVANAGTDQSVTVGTSVTLDGSASSDPEGETLSYQWNIVSAPAGSAAALSDATIVDPVFTVDLRGTYMVELIVNDGTLDSAPDTVNITVVNTAPVAHAGPDQTVLIGDNIILDGSASTDLEGDPLSYQWAILSKPAGSVSTLSNATATMPSLVIDSHGVYELQLVVNDGFDNSTPDTVLLNVGNVMPVAHAGPDQHVQIGDLITLDGSASTDADGDPLSYHWTLSSKPLGSSALLNNSDTVMPSLTIDAHGTFESQLVVNDGFEDSEPDTVLLTVINIKPVADAGPDQGVYINDVVTLDGSGSSDADGDELSYRWSILSKPADSFAVLVNADTVNPQLTIDANGMYVIQLITSDGIEDSDPDTVVLDVINVRPVADTGDDQTVNKGTTAILDGSGSSDADDDPISYHWSLLSKPAGSAATLMNTDTTSPELATDLTGLYIAQLIVNDGELDSEPDTVVITAVNQAPVCTEASAWPDNLWPPNHSLNTIALQGISDPDGDALTITVTGATQDEPVNAAGDGSAEPDAFISETVQLRSERAGGGNGRVYSIQFIADDGADSCTGRVNVSVPHDKKSDAIDDGQHYDSTN